MRRASLWATSGFAQAEREQSLRTNYTATTVLVRDRLAAELGRLEAAVPVPANAAGLSALEKDADADWLRAPFILGADGSVTTPRLTAGTLSAPPDPLATFPAAAAAVAEAEHDEFVRGDLEAALRVYRHALTEVPKGSGAAPAFIRTRTGRTLFKLRRLLRWENEYLIVDRDITTRGPYLRTTVEYASSAFGIWTPRQVIATFSDKVREKNTAPSLRRCGRITYPHTAFQRFSVSRQQRSGQ